MKGASERLRYVVMVPFPAGSAQVGPRAIKLNAARTTTGDKGVVIKKLQVPFSHLTRSFQARNVPLELQGSLDVS